MIKKIFILWFQGFDNAPIIVKKCLESWIYYNPDWNIIKLDYTNLDEYLDIKELKNYEMSLWHFSDIIRFMLLEKYGGLWVDATTFCNLSLTKWLEPFIKSGFFAFSRPSNEYLFSSWFVYSEKDNYLSKKIAETIITYFKINKKTDIYLILHNLINELYNTNDEFKFLCNEVPFFSSGISQKGFGPLFLQAIGLYNRVTPEIKCLINDKYVPLFKLTYKYDYENNCGPETILYYLFSTIPFQKPS
jgi:hypothetical protein